MTEDIDNAYATWKGWGDPAATKPGEKEIWDELHRIVGLKSGQRLLEIGFGQGSHLHYCKSKGIVGVGIEQNKTGLDIARAAGLDVYLGTTKNLPGQERVFDVIAAFDVIEHIPVNELVPLIKELRTFLKPNGKMLLSFPNGASPFGRLHQHGDLTHINAFNRSSIEQLCIATGLEIIHFGDYPEYFEARTIKQKLKVPVRRFVRAVIKKAVNAYFDHPLGLSVVAVLK